MCGIAGLSTSDRQDGLAVVRAMIGALAHRGPDDHGDIVLSRPDASAPECFLANSRLAILDLSSAGHQPMQSTATGNCIVINGEIYNHLEVRRQIGDRVQHWNSTSDTETVLRAFDVWGTDCLRRLRGMFALAIWNAADGELICARDRLGIKPLYYFSSSQAFLFASELRALLASGVVPRTMDAEGLESFVRFGSFAEPFTAISGVRSLPPGHFVRVRSGKIGKAEEFWTLEAAMKGHGYIDRLRTDLERAVSEHLLSDVPVASFLSGGLDSSIITALAARSSSRPIRTYTVGFRESEYDESAFAEQVAARYGTQHRKLVLSEAEVAAEIPDGVRDMDLPSADGLNTWIVSKAVAADGVKVVLSGLGGDELFGGYETFRVLPRARSLSPLVGRVPHDLRARLLRSDRAAQITRRNMSLEDRYMTLRALWSNREMRRMGVGRKVGMSFGDMDSAEPLLTRISVLELTGYMRDTLLRDSDAMAMAHSLELRVPFLDHEFVENCLRADVASNGRKRVLLEIAGDLLPKDFANRPKQGFVLPLDRWMRGPLRDFVREGGAELERAKLLPRVLFPELLDRFERNDLNYARVWEFVVLGHWVAKHGVALDSAPHERTATSSPR